MWGSDRFLVAPDAKNEARLPTLELDRAVLRGSDALARVEPLENPPDRRLAVGCALRVDRTRHDQPVDCARHRNVVEAQTLGPFLLALRLAHLLEAEHRAAVAVRGVHHPEAEAAVGERDDLVPASGAARVPARVGHDHDLELEPLRTVNGQEANGVRALLFGDCLELPGSEHLLVADEADEAADVTAADRLVLAGEPAELAQVREPPRPVPASEHGQVVVVLGEHLLAQPLEAEPGGDAHEPLVALAESAQQAFVARREAFGEPSLERGEERAAGGAAAEEDESVVRHTHERRREDAREGDVVVPVVEETEIREEVGDLLLAEVASTGRPIRRQPFPTQRLLVALRVGSGREEHDDLARHRLTGLDELPDARRDPPGLTLPPVLLHAAVARLVRDEELDRVAEDGIRELGGRGERLILVAERVREEMVDRGEHLRAGAVVAPERQQVLRLRTPLAKDLDIGMPEAVDRLELVAHGEDLRRLRVGGEIDQLALEPVRVLELVDHHEAKAKPHRVAHRLVISEEVTGGKLEILEVDGRLASLRGRVLGGEALEQLLEQIPVRRGEVLERGSLERLAGQLVRRRAHTPALQPGEIDHPLGRRLVAGDAKRLRRRPALVLGGRRVRGEAGRLLSKSRDRLGDARTRAKHEDEVAAGRAQRLVHAREHAPKPVCAIGGQETETLGIALGAEAFERPLERLAAQDRRAGLLELAEARVEADRERMRLEQPVAETVNRRDPGSVEVTSEIRSTPGHERGADACPELACGLARVRDDEDRVDVEPVLADRADESLHEDGGLPGAGPCGDEHVAGRLDRGELLLVEPLAPAPRRS